MFLTKISFIFLTFFVAASALAEDGLKQKFTKIQMNINKENYIIFEDECLIVCDRQTDEYLVEITPETELYVRSRKVRLSDHNRDLVRDYYLAQRTLFSKRNSIGAKGIRIGLESAKLAAKAVGGAIGVVVSGFDENVESQFEKEIEHEAGKIEYHAENIEADADEMEECIYEINLLERDIYRNIDELAMINLEVVEEEMGTFTTD